MQQKCGKNQGCARGFMVKKLAPFVMTLPIF